MKVVVKLFAAACDRTGRAEVEIDLPDSATAGDLRRQISLDYPQLEGLLAHGRLAVDAEFVGDEREITADQEVAFIPPVSGG